MANKPNGKHWREIQLAIATISVTATLGFWNLFSGPGKSIATGQAAPTAPPPDSLAPAESADPGGTSLALSPVKIIYNAIPPKQLAVQVTPTPQITGQAGVFQAPAAPTKKRKSGGGGGNPAPVQPATTGTSK